MPISQGRRWRSNSIFGAGPRQPLDRERRAVWKARIDIHRRGGQITASESYVAHALLCRLGQDGRCDPSQATLAADSGESLSTVKRALKALQQLGLVMWVRRLVREGWRSSQTSNAYLLVVGNAPVLPCVRCEVQIGRGILEKESILPRHHHQPPPTHAEMRSAQAILAERQRVVMERLANKARR